MNELSWISIVTQGGMSALTIGLVFFFYKFELKPNKLREQQLYDALLARSERRDESYREMLGDYQDMLEKQSSELHSIVETQKDSVEVLRKLQQLMLTIDAHLNSRRYDPERTRD